MPELPEAETIVRSLRPRLAGRRVLSVRFLSARVSRDRPERIAGQTVRDVRRHGKRVWLAFDTGGLLVKLGMTGRLLADHPPGPYTRARIELDGMTLNFDDIRQFGSLQLLDAEPAGMGPDPLEISAEEFAARLRGRDTQLKRLLLDQTFVRGIGNIYADEALFRAGIHPLARTRRLGKDRALRLHRVLIELLELAIRHRGSSISDYVDAAGERGGFQSLHQVYGREGEPCPACGAPIRRIVAAQRGTHFCARCQRR